MLFCQLPETSNPSYTSHYGVALCAMGDVDSDGVPDWAVGQTGRGYDHPTCIDVRSGRGGHLIWRIPIPNGPPDWVRLAAAGDIDGDGVPDLLHSQWYGADPMVVRVVSGHDGHELLRLRDPCKSTLFGDSIAGNVDFDHDGVPDIVVGAPESRSGGRVVVCSGRDGHVILEIDHANEPYFGHAVAALAHANGDDVPDIVASAAVEAGAARWSLLSGRDGSCIQSFFHTHVGTRGFGCVAAAPTAIYTTGIDDTGGPIVEGGFVDAFRIDRVEPVRTQVAEDAFSLFGTALTAEGELDGDHVRDFVVSGPEGQRGGWFAGEVTAYSGADGKRLWTVYGDAPGADLGVSLASGIDFDGDGRDDVLAGAVWLNGGDMTGQVFVISGKTGLVLRKIGRDFP